MNRLQKITAIIASLPIGYEKKFDYLYRLMAVADNQILLDYSIDKLIKTLAEEKKFQKAVDLNIDSENDKMDALRSKLSQLANPAKI